MRSTDGSHIDLSLPKHQNMISLALSNYFTVDELESLDFNEMHAKSCVKIKTEMKGEYEKCYGENFGDDGTKIEIARIIEKGVFPPVFFMNLRMVIGNSYQSDVKCTVNAQNAIYLSMAVANAINHLNYAGDGELILINKRQLIKRFSRMIQKHTTDAVIEVVMKDINEKLKQIDEDKLLDQDVIDYEYIIDTPCFNLQIDNHRIGCLKLTMILSCGRTFYIYLPKNKAGLSSIYLALDKIVFDMDERTIDSYMDGM